MNNDENNIEKRLDELMKKVDSLEVTIHNCSIKRNLLLSAWFIALILVYVFVK